MNGLLWFDNDPKSTLETKILKAIEYYKGKVKKQSEQKGSGGLFVETVLPTAELVLINPVNAEGIDLEALSKVCGLTVKAYRSVMPHHFWIGAENKESFVKQRVGVE